MSIQRYLMARIDDLITETLSISKRVLASYKKPVMGCSFGKDSMVLLHILINNGFKPPIVFYRDPWWPQKYRFADQMISEWDLETYDYPPSAITMWEGKEIMAFTNHYCVSNQTNGVLCLPKNILEPEPNRKWVCGVELLNRPKGTFQFPWDVVFIGHKSSDTDQIAGNVKLRVDIKKNSGIGPDFVFPLRNWTDDDVWEYTELYTVPQQWDRYNKATKKENPDKWTNSDYANVCISCMDRRNKSVSVYCPKMKCEVSNISSLVPYQEASMDYFGDDNGKS